PAPAAIGENGSGLTASGRAAFSLQGPATARVNNDDAGSDRATGTTVFQAGIQPDVTLGQVSLRPGAAVLAEQVAPAIAGHPGALEDSASGARGLASAGQSASAESAAAFAVDGASLESGAASADAGVNSQLSAEDRQALIESGGL